MNECFVNFICVSMCVNEASGRTLFSSCLDHYQLSLHVSHTHMDAACLCVFARARVFLFVRVCLCECVCVYVSVSIVT